MAINQPKCAVNMEQRLAALRRDQEIDGLRVYLIKYNLFPRNRDPQNSPIRIEELKELVKHWKLHRQRGFWRDHPDKDDLIRALLQHIKSEETNKKRRQEAQEKYRNKSSDLDGATMKRDFSRILGGNGINSDISSAEQSEKEKVAVVAKKKNFGGDLFYQRGDYDEGMIYLSRIDKSKFLREERNPRLELLTTSASAPVPLEHLVMLGSGTSGGGTGGNNSNRTETEPDKIYSSLLYQMIELSNSSMSSNALTKEMKVKCMEGFYNISCHHGFEMQILREGALTTINCVLKMEDIAIRMYAAATVFNLTASSPSPQKNHQLVSSGSFPPTVSMATKELYSKMMDEGVIGALLELAHTPNATIKGFCARSMFRFTIDETHHFRMVHEGAVVVLAQLMTTVPNDEVKEACMSALVNLATIPRAVTCDSILNTLIALAKSGQPEVLNVCARSLLNLSIMPTTRSNMVEEGAVAALSVLAASKQMSLMETVSCVLCNLAAIRTNQELLAKNGALIVLFNMINSVQQAFESVSEEELDEEDEIEPKQTNQPSGTEASTTNEAARERDSEGLLEEKSLLSRIRKNCANILAHLSCNPKLQFRVVNGEFVPKLLHILQDYERGVDNDWIEKETEKYCIISIANLSLDDRCRVTIVQDGAIPILLQILHDDNRQDENAMLLKLDCITALSNLMLHPKNFTRMVDEGVVPALITLIQSTNMSPDIQKACVYAMLNLAKDPGMKTRLAEATTNSNEAAIPTMIAFASKQAKNSELSGVCISFLLHLSSRQENYDVLYYEGAVGLLVRILQKPSNAEPPAVIYALWLNCMTTLSNLASHPTKRASLVEDGVVEAIQHFLNVSAADTRHRDLKSDTKIVKTQFAAAQILYKLYEACTASKKEVSSFFASLLLLATQSATKNSRLEKKVTVIQQNTAMRCALTIANVSLTSRGLRLLAGNIDIPPALNVLMRTGLHEAQVCAAIALCNLATERGQLKNRIWRDSTINDFIVITLLRVNSDQTKAICAKALFNIVTHEDTRDHMVKAGVLYALIKLARLENEEIRDLAMRSIYNISVEPTKAAQLLEMEIVRILTKMYQAEFSKEMKRIMCGILSNLSSLTSTCGRINVDEECGKNERQILNEGALGILKNLVKVRDPETKVYAANIFYNLSCCTDVAEILICDEANVLNILMTEIKSENLDVKRYAAATIANLSGNPMCVQLMTEEALVVVLNDVMKRTMATCVAITSSCVFALRNLLSLVVNQKKFIKCNGVPTLAAILTCAEIQSETQTLRVAIDLLCGLANLKDADNELEERLVRDGIVKALLAIVKGSMNSSTSATDEKNAWMRVVTSLSNLSKNVKCHEIMLRDGVLDILALLCKVNANDARALYKGLIGVRGEEFCHHCIIVLRNLSRQEPEALLPTDSSRSTSSPAVAKSDSILHGPLSSTNEVKNQRIAGQPAVVLIVLAISQTSSSETREHAIITLHNLALNRRCRMQLLKHDGVKVLLRLGTNATTPIKRHICALALQSLSKQDANTDPHIANIAQEGLVAVIATLADQHQHEILVGAASCINAIALPNQGFSKDSSTTGAFVLLKSMNKAIVQKGALPDWGKVLITSMAPWKDVEISAANTSRHGSDHDNEILECSDGSDSSDGESKMKPTAKQASPVASSSKRVASGGSNTKKSTFATPRTCNADIILGSLQLLADHKMDKAKLNMEAELAVRRMSMTVSAGSLDELPKLRPSTAPETDECSPKDVSRRQSTLTQVRQDATALSIGSSERGAAQRSLSVTTSSSPMKSPGTPKRRSYILEPLSPSGQS